MPINYVERYKYNNKIVDEICSQGDILRPIGKLLAGRGIENYVQAEKFLNPKADDLIDPFIIFGMRDAFERINKAILNNESILIYGDYDCDGLTAISMLFLYLKSLVKNVNYYVPNRHEEGYGLHNLVIEGLSENYDFDLIITVDCGITSKREIERIKSMGIDVIVTDHHEPIKELIPECIVVNPKIDGKGFKDYCGAGVVFKLIEALAGRDVAISFSGYAAIGTIADIVPLVGENRIIAKLGLEKINEFCYPFIRALASQLKKDSFNSNDIMYKVAPRINALGRLKDATPIIEFFTTVDDNLVKGIVDELEQNNRERQNLCENVVQDILYKIKNTDLSNSRVIVMADKSWNIGVLGIAASKLAETFYRPVILFSIGEDGVLKGSARSNKINVFDCLNKCADCFIEFGGHSAAAGVTMKADKFDEFKMRINKYVFENYDIQSFYPDVYFDLPIDNEIDYKCVQQLSILEPFGFGNPLPVFYLENAHLRFQQIANTAHLKSYYGDVELVAFNQLEYFESYNSETSYTFTLQNKKYKNKNYTQGIIKSHSVINPKNINEEFIAFKYLFYNFLLPHKLRDKSVKFCKLDEINLKDNIFGKLFIAFCTETYYNFIKRVNDKGDKILSAINKSNIKNPFNCIVLSPNTDFDFKYYSNIYFLDAPANDYFYGNLQSSTNANIYVVGNERANIENIKKMKCQSEEEYREIFKLIKNNDFFGAKTVFELQYKLYELQSKVSPFKVMSTMYIMLELGIIKQTEKGLEIVKNMRNTLENSIIYKYIRDFC